MMLTADDIRAMPAGRDMDAAIAALVLHWPVTEPGPPIRQYPALVVTDRGLMRQDAVGSDAHPWSPSTDIAAAWAVVEKLKADGWEPVVDGGENWSEWACECEVVGRIEAPTAPLAICRCALLATLTE